MGCIKSNSEREIYTNTTVPPEMRKTSNKQPKLTPKATRKRTKSLKVSKGGKS